MFRKLLAAGIILPLIAAISAAADTKPAPGTLSAAEIVSRNVAARGGLQAWRAVHSISMQGKLGAGGNQRATLSTSIPGTKAGRLSTDPRPAEEVMLPFVMDMQRPRKVRIDLHFKGQTAVQVFDGVNGWKLRPYLNRSEIETFTSDEVKKASMQSELDGPLVDYSAKGTRIELDGIEEVEDRNTYKLKLTLQDGPAIHVWIDAKTFLEAKIEGQPRHLDGADHAVEVYYRDYRQVNGLQIPFVLETKVLPVTTAATRVRLASVPVEQILIEKVTVNPNLEESLFAKPDIKDANLPLK